MLSLLVVCAIAGLAVFAGWALLGSSWLAAQRVTVTGERTLAERQIVSAAQVQLGTPLVRLDLAQVRQRVASLRPVASVSVHRAWPHTVAITITEREPVAAVRGAGAGWDLLDKSGVVFRHSDKQPPLPVVAVPSTRDSATLQAVAAVVTALPPRLLATVRQLSAQTMDSITLQLTAGREVRWGSADKNAAKVQVLTVLLKQRAHVYDVSVPAQPTITR